MKTQTKTTYICEQCSEAYPIESLANDCEESHIKPKALLEQANVVKARYIREDRYPILMTISIGPHRYEIRRELQDDGGCQMGYGR